MVHTIVVVEDDSDLRQYLKDLLLDNGYSVKDVADGVAALKVIKKTQPDLVILDLGLPTMGGETVCSETKKLFPDLPIIMLTAKGATSDVVKGLNLGADDYIAKPFETDELIARIRARLRDHATQNAKLKVSDLVLDKKTLEVKRGDRKIKLTPQEFKLLEYLMANKGRVLTREAILNRIWLYSPDIETRVVDVYIGYLRKKIDAGFDKELIKSVRGFGYVIKE
ncbi:MAG: response regulator transcription factor [Patescibacteria group bacterium]|jgi:DNA-binding response OmpR family regulator